MVIRQITDKEFKRFGKVFRGVSCQDMVDYMNSLAITEEVVYYPSVPELEALPSAEKIIGSLFGDMPVQIGYCAGHNNTLNAFEYHRDSEICVACTDLVVLVGSVADVTEEYTYDTSLTEAFFVPKGTVFETYATTLHYAPCGADGKGFQNVVCLPRGTNTELEQNVSGCEEDRLLLARNKWVIAHEEAGIEGAWTGLVGENIKLN